MSREVAYHDGEQYRAVGPEHPLPVYTPEARQPINLFGAPFTADYLWRLAYEGQLYVSSDAAASDTVTGQTSFAASTPTFLLRVPQGTVCVPLFINLSQTGTVAGNTVSIIVEIDPLVDRWSSGGTSELVKSLRRGQPRQASCSVWSNPTASSAYGVRMWAASVGQDVSPLEGAVQGPFWKPEMPYLLEGPASLRVYTYAGTTGPTWFWSIGWAEWATEQGA